MFTALASEPLYLAYDSNTLHYDFLSENVDGDNDHVLKSCRCGANDKDGNEVHRCVTIKYKCRCSCFKMERVCTDSCECKNCSNPFRKRCGHPSQAKNTRKRKPSASTKRMRGSKFLTERSIKLKQGTWTDEETALIGLLLTKYPSGDTDTL